MKTKKKEQNYFVKSALKEIALLRKYFKIKGKGDDVKVDGEIFATNILSFFKEYFAFIRPPKLGDDKIHPAINNSILRAFYVGQPDVNLLLNLVIRHCLYVDQIVVVDPFITLPHDQIRGRPHVWAQIIINRALCLCALEDWIREEIVLIVPSIFFYYPELNQIIANSIDRFMPKETEEQKNEFENFILERFLVNELPEHREAALDLLERMDKEFHEGMREQLLENVRKYEVKYPIRYRLTSEFYERHFPEADKRGQVLDFTLSIPLLFSPFYAEQIGAFLIFEKRVFYDTISSNQKPINSRIDSLQQLALGFQALDFQFLHNIPLNRALVLRKKGYLNSFRSYLRDLWRIISNIEENETLDDRIFEFSEKLNIEHKKLEREWNQIRKELRITAATSGLVVGLSAVSAIVTGGIDLTVGTLAGAAVIKEQLIGYMGISEKLQNTYNNPLSVFLVLEKK